MNKGHGIQVDVADVLDWLTQQDNTTQHPAHHLLVTIAVTQAMIDRDMRQLTVQITLVTISTFPMVVWYCVCSITGA